MKTLGEGLDDIRVKEIVVETTKGRSIGAAMRGAAILCLEQWVNVRLIFNGDQYFLGPQDATCASWVKVEE